jgi:hypothetical protein
MAVLSLLAANKNMAQNYSEIMGLSTMMGRQSPVDTPRGGM